MYTVFPVSSRNQFSVYVGLISLLAALAVPTAGQKSSGDNKGTVTQGSGAVCSRQVLRRISKSPHKVPACANMVLEFYDQRGRDKTAD